MRRARFGRVGWEVGEVGYGTWGLGSWKDSDPDEVRRALDLAVARGVDFFDTAAVYGDGASERLVGDLVRRHAPARLRVATKVPPLDRRWPAARDAPAAAAYPVEHVREQTYRSLERLGVDRIDLQQLHVWTDGWADDEGWQRAAAELKAEGVVGAWGISLNRWEPENGIRALRTGLVDAVQVIYNVFDQSAEDELLPVCRELDVAVIARVPFDEGSLAGAVTRASTWPEGDWRNGYFTPARLAETVDRVEALRAALPDGVSLPEAALAFVLSHPAVAVAIPGMRRERHVLQNVAASDRAPLDPARLRALRAHRWDRRWEG